MYGRSKSSRSAQISNNKQSISRGVVMEIRLRGERIRFNPFRIIILLICIYFFFKCCPYWYEKLQVLTANEKSINWIPREIMKDGSVWGNTLSPKHDLLILPYGKKNFTVNYDTDYYSISGFWGAIPKVSFSEKNNLCYKVKTVDPVPVDQYPGSADRIRKVRPYLEFSIDSNKELLHKVITTTTVLELEYPKKIENSLSFEYARGPVIREFKLLFVSPDEYHSIKKHFNEDMPETAAAIILRAVISIFFLALIIFNIKSLFKKVVE